MGLKTGGGEKASLNFKHIYYRWERIVVKTDVAVGCKLHS
jgi:hypothetical protein